MCVSVPVNSTAQHCGSTITNRTCQPKGESGDGGGGGGGVGAVALMIDYYSEKREREKPSR